MSNRNQAKIYKKRIEKLIKAGNKQEATRLSFEICKLTPSDSKAWLEAGELAEQFGYYQDAGQAYQRVLALDPSQHQAQLKLATCQMALGRNNEAQPNLHSYLMQHPESPIALHQYAKLLAKLGHNEQSLKHYLKALELTPNNAQLLMDLGALYEKQGQYYEEALKHYLHAQTQEPENADIYSSIGLIYRETGEYEKALEYFQRFQELAPHIPGAYEYYAATVAGEQGEFKESNTLFEKAIELNPGSAQAHTTYGLNLLRLGEMNKGWTEHEWRLRRSDWQQQPGHIPIARYPVWNGEVLNNKTVLVNAEQGFGDALQFCRYIPQLSQLCGKVLIYCRPPLFRTLSEIAEVDAVIAEPKQLAKHKIDVCVHMMSLPYLLNQLTTLKEPAVPYLTVPTASAELKEAMAFDGFKVGLVWRGNPSHPKNNARSLKPDQLAPLAAIKNVRYYSLEKMPQLDAPEAPASMDLINLNAHITDFHDVAAAIGEVDLVICVDTAVAHMAGALGKPVWTLLYFPADWRWQIEGSETHWYPSMRLFRQDKQKQWAPVIEEVAQALKTLTSSM